MGQRSEGNDWRHSLFDGRFTFPMSTKNHPATHRAPEFEQQLDGELNQFLDKQFDQQRVSDGESKTESVPEPIADGDGRRCFRYCHE